MKEGLSQNFGLTEREFEQMTTELREGGGQLFEKIFLAHFRDCTAYLENNCGATVEDAQDATMETMLHFRLLLIQGKLRYQNLRFLFTRMAVQWYWRWKKNTPQTDLLDGIELRPPAEEFEEESLKKLDQAWAKLGGACQQLLKEYYYHGRSTVDLAQQLNQPDANLRQRKKRCIDQLRLLFFSISE